MDGPPGLVAPGEEHAVDPRVIDQGPAGLAAATDGPASTMEELQFTLGEGPCVDASVGGRPVLQPELRKTGPSRWPGFGPAAVDAGIEAMYRSGRRPPVAASQRARRNNNSNGGGGRPKQEQQRRGAQPPARRNDDGNRRPRRTAESRPSA